jgi:hypothetical protein
MWISKGLEFRSFPLIIYFLFFSLVWATCDVTTFARNMTELLLQYWAFNLIWHNITSRMGNSRFSALLQFSQSIGGAQRYNFRQGNICTGVIVNQLWGGLFYSSEIYCSVHQQQLTDMLLKIEMAQINSFCYAESLLMPINWWLSDLHWNPEYFPGTGKCSMVMWWPVLNSWILVDMCTRGNIWFSLYKGCSHSNDASRSIPWTHSETSLVWPLNDLRSISKKIQMTFPSSKNFSKNILLF